MMGQAVGTAAALAIRHRCAPRAMGKTHIRELQEALLDDDAYLPWRPRPIPETTRRAKLSASAGDPEPLRNGTDRGLGNTDNGWWGAPGSSWVALQWDSPVRLNRARLVFDSDLKEHKRMPCTYPRQGYHAKIPGVMTRAFKLEIPDGAGWRCVREARDRCQRLERVPLDVTTSAIRFVPLESWGADRVHVFAIDVR
jgi:hypothetical protein